MSNFVVSILVEAKDAASGVFGNVGDALSGLGKVGLAVAGAGIAALGGALVAAVGNAIDAQNVFAQTEAVVKSTGGAAGLSARQMADLASSLSAAAGQSTWGDELILSGENVLATFTSIGKDVFPLATQASLDMATALHSTPEAMAMLLGKSLSSAQGLAALTKSGVRFNAEQLKTIKRLFATGHAAEAQKMILAELSTEFGGSAAAAAQTFSGQIGTLKDKFGEFLETIGTALLPMLTKAVGFLNTQAGPAFQLILDLVNDLVSGGFGVFADDLRELTGINIGPLQQVADAIRGIAGSLMAGDLSGAFSILLQGLRDLGSTIGPVLAGWGQQLVDWVAPYVPPLLIELGNLLLRVEAWAIAQAPVLLAQLQVWGRQLGAWVAPYVPVALAALAGLAGQIGAWVQTEAAALGARFLTWAQAFVAWIPGAGADFLRRWPGILNAFLDWIGTQAGPILAQLGQWAIQFVAWIAPQLPSILLALGGVVLAMLTFIGETALVLAGKLGQWGLAFLDWAATHVLPELPGILQSILNVVITGSRAPWSAPQGKSTAMAAIFRNTWSTIRAVIDAAATLIRGIITAFMQAVHGDWSGAWETIKAMSARIVLDLWQILKNGLDNIRIVIATTWDGIKLYWEQILGSIVGFVIQTMLGIANSIRNFGTQAAGAAASLGGSIVSGIADGIRNGAGAIIDAARNAAMAALNAAKNALGIHSPSTVFRVEVGRNIGAGLALGMTDAIPTVTGAARGMATSALSGAQTVTHILNYQGVHQEETDVRTALRTQALLTGAVS